MKILCKNIIIQVTLFTFNRCSKFISLHFCHSLKIISSFIAISIYRLLKHSLLLAWISTMHERTQYVHNTFHVVVIYGFEVTNCCPVISCTLSSSWNICFVNNACFQIFDIKLTISLVPAITQACFGTFPFVQYAFVMLFY